MDIRKYMARKSYDLFMIDDDYGRNVVDIDIKDRYEIYLQSNPDVKHYDRDFVPIVYWDDDGEEKIYMINFRVVYDDESVEWIECVPHEDLRPTKKYLYAKKVSESVGAVFRGLRKNEVMECNQHEETTV